MAYDDDYDDLENRIENYKNNIFEFEIILKI